ncbi:MAG: MmcQ/YjbR family DNA-binding protein [Caulobacter sp.]
MTPETFRALVLSFPRAKERAVLGTREYRVRDRAFATCGWPQDGWITVKLPTGEQEAFLARHPASQAIPGRPGVLRLCLERLDEEGLRPLIAAAWRLASALD